MSLSTALNSALSGLKANQAGIDLVAANVSNSQTAGYVKKTLVTSAQVTGGSTTGVRVDDVRREIDLYLQRQLRIESGGAAYADTRATYLNQLQTSLGTPGSGVSLDSLMSSFSSSLDALAASPQDQSARAGVLQEAQLLAQSLNAASQTVQSLRGEADRGLRAGVESANESLQTIERLTKTIIEQRARGGEITGLLDERDKAINDLSALMDIRVEDLGGGDVRIRTQAGLSLYDDSAATLAYTGGGGTMTPEAQYSSDPSKSALGTITLTRPSGMSVDLLADGQLRSGQLKALGELRDVTLPQAQTQLDELAANLAQALSTKTTAGTAITGGYDLTTDGALAGDKLSLTYTSGGATRSITIVNVGDPSRLPLNDALTADPNDTVIGIDFSSPTAATDLDAALAAKGIAIDAAASADGFAFTSGAAGTTIDAGSSKTTATALSGDGLALPLFVDGAGDMPFSGSLDGGDQRLGFAGRIAVNPALLDDPSKLVLYEADTAQGDQSRVDFLRQALSGDIRFRADTGIGGTGSPFTGTLGEFARSIVATQANASATASRVAEGQGLVVSALSDRFSSASGVDVDEEMGRLIQFQTAYTANARVMTAAREMLDMLLRI